MPNGEKFELREAGPGNYLTYETSRLTLELSSDSITHSYQNREKLKPITEQLVEEVQNFRNLGYTIGGSIIFPSKKIEGKMTINGARGFNVKIADRFDLTLECIRLHYLGGPNPLDETLNVNSNFFDLFHSFSGYVDFFLLQDLVTPDYSQINFFTEINLAFDKSPLPQSLEEYLTYMQRNIDFLNARNRRIAQFAKESD